MPGTNQWYLVSSHGSVLFYIAAHPDSTVAQIADALSLTWRTIWNIVRDLRRSGMVKIRKEGRRHHYSVDMDATFRHPALPAFPLRVVLSELAAGAGRPSASCARAEGPGVRRSLARLGEPELAQKVRDVRLAMVRSQFGVPPRSSGDAFARSGGSER